MQIGAVGSEGEGDPVGPTMPEPAEFAAVEADIEAQVCTTILTPNCHVLYFISVHHLCVM